MFMIGSLILALVAIYLAHIYVSWDFDYWKKRNVPFVKPIPFFGNLFKVITFQLHISEFIRDLCLQFDEPFFGMFMFGTPYIVVQDEELLKNILVKDFHHFPDHTFHHSSNKLSAGLLICMKTREWKTMRQKLTPFFATGKMKNFLSIFKHVCNDLLKYVQEQNTNDSIETKELFAKYSTDVIGKTAFAIEANSFKDEDAEFRKAGRLTFKYAAMRFFLYSNMPRLVDFLGLELFNSEAGKFFREVFSQSVELRENYPKVGNDLIDCIVELKRDEEFCSKQKFEGDKILAQAMIFFIAGFESTSSMLSFTLFELANNHEIQDKARREIEKNVKKHGCFNYECMQDMDYIEMILLETLRKYPPLPIIDRMCAKDYKIPGTDVVIEKGIRVIISLLTLHYDERYFPNPQKYDPERFADKDRVPFIHMPFSKGPRSCFGGRYSILNAKLALATILSQFEVDKSMDTPKCIKFDPTNYLLSTKGGIPVSLKKLEHNRIAIHL